MGRVCLALSGATLDHTFGDDHDVYKVGSKMFAMVGGMGGVSFKVSDIAYEKILTETGHARPTPYLARAKWVNLHDPADWSDEELADHLATAYEIVAGKLTKAALTALSLS